MNTLQLQNNVESGNIPSLRWGYAIIVDDHAVIECHPSGYICGITKLWILEIRKVYVQNTPQSPQFRNIWIDMSTTKKSLYCVQKVNNLQQCCFAEMPLHYERISLFSWRIVLQWVYRCACSFFICTFSWNIFYLSFIFKALKMVRKNHFHRKVWY